MINCYHNLAKQIAVALQHEERRCGYLTAQKNIMWGIQDEVASLPEREGHFCFIFIVFVHLIMASWLRQVESYLKDTGMTGQASAWAMAKRRPKEY